MSVSIVTSLSFFLFQVIHTIYATHAQAHTHTSYNFLGQSHFSLFYQFFAIRRALRPQTRDVDLQQRLFLQVKRNKFVLVFISDNIARQRPRRTTIWSAILSIYKAVNEHKKSDAMGALLIYHFKKLTCMRACVRIYRV